MWETWARCLGSTCCLVFLAFGTVPKAQAPAVQAPAAAEYEVVSIKPSKPDTQGGGIQTLPDGTFVMRNHPIRSIVLAASPVPVREVEGLPDWVTREPYDIMAKPPAGSTRSQQGEMLRRMLEDRMQVKGHVEERERTILALIVARSDGRLGPQLKPSALDCSKRPDPTAVPTPPTGPPEGRCGGLFGPGQIVSGGITLDTFAASISGLAGGQVINRTGLAGFYALTLRFAVPQRLGGQQSVDDAPELATALQDQLGLKLQAEKAKVPIFVVDHIARPSAN
jgi:uncharacterized protein (TIGR03435 family)